MKRGIIKIDEEKCNGCGNCIPGCPEGAIRIIEGKARLAKDSLCDGLGACLGECPLGAITIEERESDAYDERLVIENISKEGLAAVRVHLKHLNEHNEREYLETALLVLKEKGVEIPEEAYKMESHHSGHPGCPGSRSMSFTPKPSAEAEARAEMGSSLASELSHWPIQLHLISPLAPHYFKADLLLCADCVPFTIGDFHAKFLKGKTLAVACPKLDEGQEIYEEKLTALIDEAQINTLTVMVMEVPCCGGLVRLAQAAAAKAQRKVPVKCVQVSLQGEILREAWV